MPNLKNLSRRQPGDFSKALSHLWKTRRLCNPPVCCSKRCADIDLHRWLGGVYAIPAAAAAAGGPDEETDGQDADKN